jgi:RND superfamily putative drug exporter
VSRFREELKKGLPLQEAIAVTESTAGKTVLFSGLCVFICMSVLLIFPMNLLVSAGIAGMVVAFVAVIVALVLLLAILAILGKRIDAIPVKLLSFNRNLNSSHKSFWRWLAVKVMHRPLLFFFSALFFLLLLGYPVIHIQLNRTDESMLPTSVESRQVYDIYKKKFGENALEPIIVVIKSEKNILAPDNIYYLYEFANEIAKDPRVKQIYSIVTIEPGLNQTQYQYLYSLPSYAIDQFYKQYLQQTTRKNLTVMTVISNYPSYSKQTQDLVSKIRNSNPGNGMTLQVTGIPVSHLIDLKNDLYRIFPYAILLLAVIIYFMLMLLFRSVLLPLKAIIMNILSLTASYGILVFVFQQGHLSHWLNFQPRGFIDMTLPLIMFNAVFGISMDYEIFLLSRIKEHYELSGDNTASVAFGLERSGKIITSAALIVVLVCGAFLTAEIILVKAFGLGMAAAVAVDATIIRAILVPATMRLLGKWNWYVPKWLDKILPNIRFAE